MRTRASESTIAAERISWRSLFSFSLFLYRNIFHVWLSHTHTHTHTNRSANVPASRKAEILLPIFWSIVSYVCMNNTHTDSGDDVWCAFWSQWICMHLFAHSTLFARSLCVFISYFRCVLINECHLFSISRSLTILRWVLHFAWEFTLSVETERCRRSYSIVSFSKRSHANQTHANEEVNERIAPQHYKFEFHMLS